MTDNVYLTAELKARLVRLIYAHPLDAHAILFNIIDTLGYEHALPHIGEESTQEELERVARMLVNHAASIDTQISIRERSK